ncbi:protein involved in ribonucleotide reduction [Amaricoccus macauensis]|uniref:Protein involved in ribonucleotide reduction n=1 Tax=Amaricoccus macauensis TaxID=57001 RepID=A0A840SJ79_9RHOB|nr:hypothetical protein [Amaricoccus macauensis]MBB5221947.1 protein involved in ribonucleotide reduction [Amaricoccus macauensis]
MTNVRVWLSHDGYTDPDDNLAQLVGAAQARAVAKSDSHVKIGGFVYGDTIDGGQFKMLHPFKPVPGHFAYDPRYQEDWRNAMGAGNYEFHAKYGAAAIRQLAPGWDQYDLLKADAGGQRAWNFDANTRGELTAASRELADDIVAAIGKGGVAEPNEVVVYSAGGGANVAAESIGYLLNRGFAASEIREHFAVVQHGNSNWWQNQEDEARDITRTYTIALSEQDPNSYANGDPAPGLKWLVRQDVWLDGARFGESFRKAAAVAQGLEAFQGLTPGKSFRPTTDGSDAGSHAFAVDVDALLNAWDVRLKTGWNLPNLPNTQHLIKGDGQFALRVMYDEFDWLDARRLMNGSSNNNRSTSADDDRSPASAAYDDADHHVGALSHWDWG